MPKPYYNIWCRVHELKHINVRLFATKIVCKQANLILNVQLSISILTIDFVFSSNIHLCLLLHVLQISILHVILHSLFLPFSLLSSAKFWPFTFLIGTFFVLWTRETNTNDFLPYYPYYLRLPRPFIMFRI